MSLWPKLERLHDVRFGLLWVQNLTGKDRHKLYAHLKLSKLYQKSFHLQGLERLGDKKRKKNIFILVLA